MMLELCFQCILNIGLYIPMLMHLHMPILLMCLYVPILMCLYIHISVWLQYL